MDSQGKASFNGIEGVEGKDEREVMVTKSKAARVCDLLLRLLALALTFVATLVLGVDKQTTVVPVKISDSLPPLNVPVTAEWHYLSAFVYFVVANAIASAYAALSLLLGLANRGGIKGLGALMFVLDALTVALLFSGNGAAMAVSVIGYQGNSHVQWKKVCNVFGKFCDQVAAAILLSLLGSISFLLLMLLPVLRLPRSA